MLIFRTSRTPQGRAGLAKESIMLIESKHLDYLKAFKGLVSVLRDPSDLPSVFQIINGLRHTQAFRSLVSHLIENPETGALIRERYMGPTPNLDELKRLPAGSLGHAFATHMLDRGLTVEFYPVIDVKDDVTYIEQRLRATHDIWHVVTGIDVTAAAELSLQAFMMAQGVAPLGAALIGGGLLRGVFSEAPPELETNLVMDGVAYGWRMGRKAKPLFAQRWELAWDKPLAHVRTELCIEIPA
jgi:ubiquinone biosynthesis protein COQ4